MNKILKNCIKGITTSLLLVGIPYFLLEGIPKISDYTSQKINNQSQLELVLEKERKKLNIRKEIKIRAKLYNNNRVYVRKINNEEYKIVLGKDTHLGSLKHELYHIFKKHNSRLIHVNSKYEAYFKYFMIFEPQANIYELTGLDLSFENKKDLK